MNRAIPENTTFSGSERTTLKWIELPDDLEKWADRNQELVERVQNALSDTYGALTDNQLWEVVAAADSPEWQEARTGLSDAEHRRADMNSPEKTSLGLIGHALDSDETNAAEAQFSFSLARFTIINEGLRQREDLSRLLSVLLVQKRMLEHSAERTRALQKVTADFAQASTKPEAYRPRKTFGIAHAFSMHAAKLFKPKKSSLPIHASAKNGL